MSVLIVPRSLDVARMEVVIDMIDKKPSIQFINLIIFLKLWCDETSDVKLSNIAKRTI